jgi:hypothetical protein
MRQREEALDFLATCSEREKAGISMQFMRCADDVIPLLVQEGIALPPLPAPVEVEHCLTSDEEDEVEDMIMDEEGVIRVVGRAGIAYEMDPLDLEDVMGDEDEEE